jgi:hypothetical protein
MLSDNTGNEIWKGTQSVHYSLTNQQVTIKNIIFSVILDSLS